MKIKHITGEILDTDTLPDVEAMVLEKVEEFRKFCFDNKVPFVIFIDPKGLDESNHISFWNFANRVNNYTGNSEGAKPVNFTHVLKSINSFVYGVSNGRVCLAKIPEES